MKQTFILTLTCWLGIYMLLIPFYGYSQTEKSYKELLGDIENPQPFQKFIDSIIMHEMDLEHLPGVAFAFIHKDSILYQKGYGVPDIDNAQKVSVEETIFRTGSISKVFTAMGIMQLVDQGLINLNDDVNSYLEDDLKLVNTYPETVKIWHLLTHTAGFDQKLAGRLFENKEIRPALGEFLKGELTLIRPPGKVSSYDTYGITLAGRIVENVSGLSYADYMREKIFTPLGMTKSFVEVSNEQSPKLAIGYGYENGEFIPQKYELYATTPASSIDATTLDMAKFMQAILRDGSNSHGRMLSKKSMEQIKQPQYRNHPEMPGFSYGFWEDLSLGERGIWHGGIMNGYTSTMYLFPEHEIGFYLVYNRDFETGPDPRLRYKVTKALKDRWFGSNKNPATPQKTSPIDIPTNKFSGTYASMVYCHLCFEGEGAGRRIHSIESLGNGMIKFMRLEFRATDSLTFVDESGKNIIAFKENESREITHVFGNFSSDAVYEKLGEPLLKEALGIDYQSKDASPLKAMTYRGMHDWEKAISEYQKITRLRPNDGRAFHYLGFCHKSAGNDENAIAAFTKSYELGKWREYNLSYIAEIYTLNESYKEAMVWIAKIVTLKKELGASIEETKQFIFGNPILKELEDRKEIKALFIK